jgi:hypothetical protein
VKFKLRPTVLEIQRAEQAAEPTVTAVRRTGRYPRAAQVLALALQLQEMIDSGEVRDYADLACLGCVSRERISQIMMLAERRNTEISGRDRPSKQHFDSPVSSSSPPSGASVLRSSSPPR